MNTTDNGSTDVSTEPPEPTHGLSMRRRAAIGVLAAIIIAAGYLMLSYDRNTIAASGSAGSGATPEALTTDVLSEFHQIEFTTLTGEAATFADFSGKPTLLNFFASWCGPCIAEMPTIEALHQEFKDELNVVGLAFEGARPALEVVDQTGVMYLTGLDEDGTLLERFDGIGMPTTVFIDADGNIVDTHIGELSESAFRDKFRKHFGLGNV